MNTSVPFRALCRLGDYLRKALAEGDDVLTQKMLEAYQKNNWFTEPNVRMALSELADQLTDAKLSSWLSAYTLDATKTPKRVGVIMAGNLPVVGFHDLVCVLLSGHVFVGKSASSDAVLPTFLIEQLVSFEPTLAARILLVERLENVDAVIATGSNNTNRYFDYYFGKLPHLFRGNRNSVALITGKETPEQMTLLADDIFQYFGLGCRSVSKILLPKGYDFGHFYVPMDAYAENIGHHKYANNYNYQRTVYALNAVAFLDNGFLILKEDQALSSTVSVMNYEYYDTMEMALELLYSQRDRLQCVAMAEVPSSTIELPFVSFGETQHPGLADYADGADTLAFLLQI